MIQLSVLQVMDAFVSFRRVRGLIVFLPLLKLIIAHLATPPFHCLVSLKFTEYSAKSGSCITLQSQSQAGVT
jgi:uncharacterized SAM-binding protein YcdF (DUF218 family)